MRSSIVNHQVPKGWPFWGGAAVMALAVLAPLLSIATGLLRSCETVVTVEESYGASASAVVPPSTSKAQAVTTVPSEPPSEVSGTTVVVSTPPSLPASSATLKIGSDHDRSDIKRTTTKTCRPVSITEGLPILLFAISLILLAPNILSRMPPGSVIEGMGFKASVPARLGPALEADKDLWGKVEEQEL